MNHDTPKSCSLQVELSETDKLIFHPKSTIPLSYTNADISISRYSPSISSSSIKSLEEVKQEINIKALEMELNPTPATKDDISSKILNSISSVGSLK